MKSKYVKFLIVALVIVILMLAVPMINLLRQPSRSPLTMGDEHDPVYLAAASALESNCLDCHSSVTQKPAYAAMPVVGGQVENDVRRGRRFINLVDELTPRANRPPSEAALAKLEYIIEHDQMPLTRYTLMHWNTILSDEEKQAVLQWIGKVRKTHYAPEGVDESVATGPLHPLPQTVETDQAKVALGDVLYHDARLSGDGTISCATCHDLATGGVDRLPVSTGIDDQQGPINAPTVYNAVFHVDQFWDGRADDLAAQAAGPVTNPLEMGADWETVIDRLRKDEKLVEQFEALYPDGLTINNITDAIAEFEKSLVTPDSDFDRSLKGDQTALSDPAKRGYHLFTESRCATCHVGKAMGGQSYERMGLWKDYFTDRGEIKEVDHGRYNVTGLRLDKHKFKVPSLRNIALTEPYFHDASAKTLKDAVRTMMAYQTDVKLTDDEIADMTAFLKSLTGKYKGKPLDSLEKVANDEKSVENQAG
jgi:cytochrome c peroxidase